MALKEYRDGEYRELGGINHRVDGQTKPLSALYQFVNGAMVAVWEAIKYIAAWTHRSAWKHGEPW